MEFPKIRIGLAGAPNQDRDLVARQAILPGCSDLYLYPNASSVVDSTLPVTFKWDTKCKVDTTNIDLYVYQPDANNALIQKFTDIPFTSGNYTAKIWPQWANGTDSTLLYVNILKAGAADWDTSWSAGPQFNVTYPSSPVVTISGSAYTQPINTGKTTFDSVTDTSGKKSNKAVIAVAVVIPIVVVCILAAIAFYFYRIKEKKKLQRWSHALSQHSQLEWEKGALPGERVPSSYGRPSSGYSRGRPSTGYGRPSTGYGRPSMSSVGRPTSSVMLDNMAGAGAGYRYFPGSEENPSRTSMVLPDGQVRQPRISFADTARPRISSDNRPRVASGLHNQNASVDELRNLEAVQFVTHPGDDIEDLEHAVDDSSIEDKNYNSHEPAMGPDQMLAVYAQRAGATSPISPSSPTPPPNAATTSSKVKRFLSRKDKKPKVAPQQYPQDIRVTSPSPDPVQMRSYVHLNNGTASAQVVDNLPAPGPPRSLDAHERFADA